MRDTFAFAVPASGHPADQLSTEPQSPNINSFYQDNQIKISTSVAESGHKLQSLTVKVILYMHTQVHVDADFYLCCFSGLCLTSDTFSAPKGSTSLSQLLTLVKNENKGFPYKNIAIPHTSLSRGQEGCDARCLPRLNHDTCW